MSFFPSRKDDFVRRRSIAEKEKEGESEETNISYNPSPFNPSWRTSEQTDFSFIFTFQNNPKTSNSAIIVSIIWIQDLMFEVPPIIIRPNSQELNQGEDVCNRVLNGSSRETPFEFRF